MIAGIDVVTIGHEDVHAAYIFGAFTNDVGGFTEGGVEAALIESADIVEDFLGADTTGLFDANTLELSIENEVAGLIVKGHVVFDGDTLIAKGGAGVNQQKRRLSKAGEIVFPNGSETFVDLPVTVNLPGHTPAVTLILFTRLTHLGKVSEVLIHFEYVF